MIAPRAASRGAPRSYASPVITPSRHPGLHAIRRLVALGVTTAQRFPALPHVPTLAEAGAAGYAFPIWYSVWAPAGTPPGIVEQLAGDITAAIAQPDVHDRLGNHCRKPTGMTPEVFARFVIGETHRAARIIHASGSTRVAAAPRRDAARAEETRAHAECCLSSWRRRPPPAAPSAPSPA